MGKLLLAIVVLLAGFAGAIYVASNHGEVVALTTRDAKGADFTTPLWVVDEQGAQYLRAGNRDSSWCDRIRGDAAVTVERGGKTARYQAVFAPEMTPQIEKLMAEKYGWADQLIGVIRRPGASVAIRLQPAAS